MFHPLSLRLLFVIPHSTADAMTLVSVFKVEEDLQQARREEREREVQAGSQRVPDTAREKKTGPWDIYPSR